MELDGQVLPFFDCSDQIKPFKCKACPNFQTNSSACLRHHIVSGHQVNNFEEKIYKCVGCSFVTSSRYLHLQHGLFNVCASIDDKEKRKRLQEKSCRNAETTITLKEDSPQAHREDTDLYKFMPSTSSRTESNGSDTAFSHSNDWFECDQCPAKFNEQQCLRRHNMTHQQSKVEEIHWFKCDQCPYKSKEKNNLRRHVITSRHTKPVGKMFPVYDMVCVLLETHFSRWTDDDRKDLLCSERAMPVLSVAKTATIRNKVFIRNFKERWYSDFDWLCGSYYLQRLFCVPCLAIGVKSSVWNNIGFNDYKNVTRALKKHEGSVEHLQCALSFLKLRKNLTTDEDASTDHSRLDIKSFNENVHLNRRFMQLPIRTVLYLGRRESAFQEDASPVNRGSFKELLETLISVSPVDVQEHYKKIAPLFAGNFKTFRNELVDCISQYIADHVEREIRGSKFFSIQVDGSMDIVQQSLCSIIVRYVNSSGKLMERFLGFHDVSTAETLFHLERFDFKSKLIGQCYDGASAMWGQLNGLRAKIKEQVPQAVLAHCLAYHLSSVLQQSCNNISNCRIFFAAVSGLPAFFHRTRVLGRRVPSSVITRWTSNSKILSVIIKEWDCLKQLFIDIVNDPASDQSSVRQSDGFLNNFNNFEFAFLTVVFNDIFGVTDGLQNVLQKRSLDVNVCISQIRSSQLFVNDKRNEGAFRKLFDLAALKTTLPTEGKVLQKYKGLYYEILDTLSRQMVARFQDTEKLHFVALLDTSKFVTYSQRFPTEALRSLQTCYSNLFADIPRLKNELQLIYRDEQYKDMKLQRLMELLYENSNIFKEAWKLCALIVTVPSTSASGERSVSCLKRIQTYLRSQMTEDTEDRLTNLARISVERELLADLIQSQPFYDDVIDRFASLTGRRIELVYKKLN